MMTGKIKNMFVKHISYKTALLIVLLISILIRVILLIIYDIKYQNSGDDVEYRTVALNIMRNGIILGQGQRGYLYSTMLSVLWSFFGDYPIVVVLTQMIFGICTSLIWANILWRVSLSEKVALYTGLAVTLFMPSVILEMRLLTESLSLIIFALISKYFIEYMITKRIRYIIICSIWMLFFGLIRISVVYIFIVPLSIIIFNNYRVKGSLRKILIPIIVLISQCIITLLIIFTLNFKLTGYVYLSSLSGGSLSGMICKDMHFPNYSDIETIYVKYRNIYYEKYGNCEQSIWGAYPEIIQKTGLSSYEIDKILKDTSLSIIKKRPNTYLNSVTESISRFMLSTPIYGEQSLIKMVFMPAQYFIMISVFISIGYVFSIRKNINLLNINIIYIYIQWISLSFLYMMLTHTLFSTGDIGRYRYPVNILPYTFIIIVLYINSRNKSIDNRVYKLL